jgi:LysM repeat protein
MDKSIWQKRSKFLLQALIFSVALNIALLSTFCFFLLRKSKEQGAADSLSTLNSQAVKPIRNGEILRLLCEKNFPELLELLDDKQLLEDGYLRRDFALSILVAFHQFNLEKAVGGLTLQPRQILFSHHPQGESTEILIFSGLNDEQYEAIIKYAKTERWPLTTEGLFFEVKRAFSSGGVPEPGLIRAFSLSQEYLSIATLLHRGGCSVTKEELLELLSEGEWSIIKNFSLKQKQGQDLTPEQARLLLVEYVQHHSKKAARLLLRCDVGFTAKRLSDDEVLFVLDAAEPQDKYVQVLAKALLCSTRGERVIRVAASKLYAQSGETMPSPFQLLEAIKRFCPEAIVKQQQPVVEKKLRSEEPLKVSIEKSVKKERFYVVQNGDSLWKIAKKHHVSIERIKKENHLEGESLKPGQELKIP